MATQVIETTRGIGSIDEVQESLRRRGYITDRSLATSIFLALRLGRPLLLEGEAGVGKTEVAKVLAALLGRDLVRLQCYEGIDASQA
ncbi:MAG: AAA family ATPase, partial [Chloroflexota bacterium]|nr:AAA family ATPase [Chloroflexota bacterium]